MDISTDSYFQHPEKYYRESKPSIDKKRLNSLFEKYKGITFLMHDSFYDTHSLFYDTFVFENS